MARKTKRQRVTVARQLARDALIQMTSSQRDIDALVDLALLDYGAKFYDGKKPPQAWVFYDGNPKTKTISRKNPPERVDVFCLFCRVMLVTNADLNFDYTLRIDVRNHTTNCAVRSMAGQIEPGAPHTYRLPEEL